MGKIKCTYILLLLTIIAVVALMEIPGASAQNSGQLGKFIVVYNPVTHTGYNNYNSTGALVYVPYSKKTLQIISNETQFFNIATNFLNNVIALPRDVPIYLTECAKGTPNEDPNTDNYINAYYINDSGNSSITMCHEYLDDTVKSFEANETTQGGLEFDVFHTQLFLFFHETGHGFIDLFNLPVATAEETNADGLATWLLLQGGDTGANMAFSAARSWIINTRFNELNDPADVHPSNQQRYYNIVCWIVGSNPQKYLNPDWIQPQPPPDIPRQLIPDDYRLPDFRAEGCKDEYNKLDKTWYRFLSPHLLNVTPTPNATATPIIFSTPTGLGVPSG